MNSVVATTTIKTLIDLVANLHDRIKDRKFTCEISQIQSLISTVQSENASLMSENFGLKQEISKLKEEIVSLKKKMSDFDGGGFTHDMVIPSSF